MDKLDFLDGPAPADTPVVATPTADTPPADTSAPAEQTAQTSEQANDGRARGPDGKFVSKAEAAPVVDATSQPPAIPPATTQQPPAEQGRAPDGYVPLAALTDLRKEFNSFKQSVQQQAPPPPPAPDHYADPDGYRAWADNQQIAERVEWSRQLAEVRHGPELVAQAQEWAADRFNRDPIFQQRAAIERDPYSFAIAEYQQAQALQMLSDPKLLEQFRAFASGRASTPQAATPPPPQSPIAPPPSITQAPAAGGAQSVPTGPGQAYGAIFG